MRNFGVPKWMQVNQLIKIHPPKQNREGEAYTLYNINYIIVPPPTTISPS